MKKLACSTLLSLVLFSGATHAGGQPSEEALKFANKHCMAGVCLGQSLEDVASKVNLTFVYSAFKDPTKVSESKCTATHANATFLTEQGLMLSVGFHSFPGHDEFMKKLRLSSIKLSSGGGENGKLTAQQRVDLFNSIVARNKLPRPPASNTGILKSKATGAGVNVVASYMAGFNVELMMYAPALDTWMLSQPGCGVSPAGI